MARPRSSAQVHKWRTDGLLPPTDAQVSAGRRGFATVRASGVEEQLLALCDFRSETRSWNLLAILLWVDSWPIAIERLRAAKSRLASPGPKGEARPTLRPDAQRAPGPERPTTGSFQRTSARLPWRPDRRIRWSYRLRSRLVQNVVRRPSRIRNGWPHSRQSAAPGSPSLMRRHDSKSWSETGARTDRHSRCSRHDSLRPSPRNA